MSTVLIMRSCGPDLRSYNDFQWPEAGPVSAPDWQATEECGNGLHGFLWGQGDESLANQATDAKWLVVEADGSNVIDLGGQVKFSSGTVVFCGEAKGAAAYIQSNGGAGKKVMHATLTGGNGSTLTGGYLSTLTGGHHSTLTGGHHSTLTGGDHSTLTGGDHSTLTGGYGSCLLILFCNGQRLKAKIGQVRDEDGDGPLEPNQPYKLNEAGDFVLAGNGGAA